MNRMLTNRKCRVCGESLPQDQYFTCVTCDNKQLGKEIEKELADSGIPNFEQNMEFKN